MDAPDPLAAQAAGPLFETVGAHGGRSLYLSVGSLRDAAFAAHPLVLDDQLLQTPAISLALTTILKAARLRKFGCSFYGAPRFGKTFAIDALVSMLETEMPEALIMTTEAFLHDTPTEKALWEDFLISQKHVCAATARKSRMALIDFIVSSAALNSNARLLILFVDEAQNWGVRQWRYLKGLVNLLRGKHYRIHTLVVSFGQANLLDARADISATQSDGGADLLARFLDNMNVFKGIESRSDMTEILTQLDDAQFTEYPEDSGICYTEFFLPLAYADGFRLGTELPRLWSRFGKRSSPSLKMELVMDTIKEFFLKAEDAPSFRGTEKLWKDAHASAQAKEV